MLYANTTKTLVLSLVASAFLAGCGSNETTQTSSSVMTTISGVAIDPELQGATVFLDANGNGVLDSGELQTLTDALGNYRLEIPQSDVGKTLVVMGGVDKVTKERFLGKLTAVSEATRNTQHITPLTTLVQKFKKLKPATSLDVLKAELASKLNLNVEDFEKNIAETGNESLLKVALRVHKVAKNIALTSAKDEDGVYEVIASKLANTQDLDTAIGETIRQEVASGTLQEAKVRDLDNELKSLATSLNPQEFALTVDNIEKSIQNATNEAELSVVLAEDETIKVTSDNEAKEERLKRVLKALGLEHLDIAIQAKIAASDKIDFQNDTLGSIREKIINNDIGLTQQELFAVKRELYFSENGLNDLDTTTREDLQQKFQDDNFDFANATQEDFEKKLNDTNFLGNDEDLEAKVKGHQNEKIASEADGIHIVGSLVKGPIDGAVVKLKDDKGELITSALSQKGLFGFEQVNLDAPYYTIESIGGSYEDEATKTVVNIQETQGLKTFVTKTQLSDILTQKQYLAITPETTLYAEMVVDAVQKGTDVTTAMQNAQTLLNDAMIKDSSPMPSLQGDIFLQTGDFTSPFPKDTSEAFARNRAISFSYMVRDLNLSANDVFNVLGLVGEDLKDGRADGITLADGRDVNVTEAFALARTKLFQDTTAKLRNGELSDGQKEQLKQMGFDVSMFDNSAQKDDANLSAIVTTYLQSTTLPTLHTLPLMQDEDGNVSDAKETYTLQATTDVNVTIQTPDGSWITPMWRYNNQALPVVIHAKRGDAMTLNFENNLSSDSTIHWHGFKIPADMDGGPDVPVAPQSTKVYSFTMDQPAAPLWFHPHPDMQTGKQVYMGLAGVYILEDTITQTLEANKELPSGDKDTILLVQDRRFNPEQNGVRELAYKNMEMDSDGMYGDTVLVNGSVMPKQEVSTTLHRYRLYNVSNARTYDFALSDGSSFYVVGTDGGLLQKPVEVDHIMLGAAERVEIVIDFSKYNVGEKVLLVSKPFNGDMMGMMGNQNGGMNGGMQNRMAHDATDGMGNDMNTTQTNGMMDGVLPNGTALGIMRFDINQSESEDITLYTQLPTNAEISNRIDPATANNQTNEREFVMSMGGMGNGMNGGSMGNGSNGMQMSFVINGKSFDASRVDEFVPAGATEIWSIKNMSPMAHPFHAHAIQYQILTRNGKPATGTDLGWKDTFLVQPGETIRVIGDFSSAKGDYMYHCHILEHEDAGMMGYFRVGESGNLGAQ